MNEDKTGKSQPQEILRRRNEKLQAILDVAMKLGSERNVDKLLDHILTEVKRIIDADRCSLFLVDEERQELWTKIAQGLDTSTIRLPIRTGIAGECATRKEPILIQDAYQDPRFNQEVDRLTGYKTYNILAVPMLDLDGHCTGVIQALNKKDEAVFTEEDQELLMALGGQAAVALENARLHQDIEKLFEGFIRASVYAIEARDPTTSGHSERVAVLTVSVAEAINHQAPPNYRDARFSHDELRELRYAALLHDFGKVGVRESVLVKANKLHPHELCSLEDRFSKIRKDHEIQILRRQLEHLKAHGNSPQALEQLQLLELTHQKFLEELDDSLQFILACNRPTVLDEGDFQKLQSIYSWKAPFELESAAEGLLRESEVLSLSVRRGSLSPDERQEIQSHVTHTFSFLSQIPWTRDLRRVPEIAFKHHEKLNGSGYPQGVPAEDIPIQARIMAICDIYDALTAKDRPYKKAIPHDRALFILEDEAKRGAIDSSLLQVFIDSKAHKSITELP